MTTELKINPGAPLELILQSNEHQLRFGMGCPVGPVGIKAAANVGGGAAVFRDAIANVLNFRTLVGLGPITIAVNGDVIEINAVPIVMAVDPSPADDVYQIGRLWINSATNQVFVLANQPAPTAGDAIWRHAAGPLWVEDGFISTVGQVTFVLSKAPTELSTVEFDVNGVNYKSGGSDYTLSGTTITWLNNAFVMDAGDRVLVRYR